MNKLDLHSIWNGTHSCVGDLVLQTQQDDSGESLPILELLASGEQGYKLLNK